MGLTANREKALKLVGTEMASLIKNEHYDLNKLNSQDLRKVRQVYLSLAKFFENHNENEFEPYILTTYLEAILKNADMRHLGRYYPKGIKEIIFKRDGYKCLCCRATDNLTIDHIIPVSLGGTTEIDNLQTLCMRCNRRKHTKTENWRLLHE